MKSRESVEDRFYAKVKRSDDPTGCWVWTAARDQHGYGNFHVGPEDAPAKAHRFSYELNVGPIPHGMVVRQHCGNRACVKPDHLYVDRRRGPKPEPEPVAAAQPEPEVIPVDIRTDRYGRISMPCPECGDSDTDVLGVDAKFNLGVLSADAVHLCRGCSNPFVLRLHAGTLRDGVFVVPYDDRVRTMPASTSTDIPTN